MTPQTITRWPPFPELADLRSRLDRMFADVTDGGHASWSPAIDVVRREGALAITVEVPGVEPSEIEIDVVDDVLTVSGRHEEQRETSDDQYVRRERRVGAFSRSIALPAGVDASAISAKGHHGVLEISVPLPTSPEHTKVKVVPELE